MPRQYGVTATSFLLVSLFALGTFPAATVSQQSRATQLAPANPPINTTICPGSFGGPCPMGVTDYGFDGKTNSFYRYAGVSFLSSITFTKLKIGNSSISGITKQLGVQLNTVAYQIYQNGNPGAYWTQDVAFVKQESREKFVISAVDNIWNWSAHGSVMSINVQGNLEGNCALSGIGMLGQYFCVSKENYTTTLPFTIELEIEAAKISQGIYSNDSSVEFTFSVFHGTVKVGSTTFDKVAFSGPAPTPPYFLVAYTYAPIGSPLRNDAETVIGGPGGGSSVEIISIAASIAERYQPTPGASFRNVPHAYSEGHDTAESASGVRMVASSSMKGLASFGFDNSIQLW